MTDHASRPSLGGHSHVFLSEGHGRAERRTWAVIALCAAMMVAEVVGGLVFGSIALVADGLHMSTHAGALLLAALAYSYARKHAGDGRFTFGTGKLGDLAGFTSAVALAMIALLIGYEALSRLFDPVSIRFGEAIPIACFGLAVNIASVWLLGGDHHGHSHGHAHPHKHGHDHDAHDEGQRFTAAGSSLSLSVFEHAHPTVFRIEAIRGALPKAANIRFETVRPGNVRQDFTFERCGDILQTLQEIPEPHAFRVEMLIGPERCAFTFEEHGHEGDEQGAVHRDNNMRAAVVHVMADAAVSLLVIVGLVLARTFGWLWMDPVAGLVGAFVIASWSYGLIRDTGAILLDMEPDTTVKDEIRRTVESEGDAVTDLHVWRLGPGHLGAIVSVSTREGRDLGYYRERLGQLPSLSHLTVEIEHAA